MAYVEQMVEASKDAEMLKRLQKAQLVAANGDVPKDQLITKEKAESFSKFSFAKQYAEGIRQNGEITPEMREEIRGSWIKYQQGTDPTALWASLQNKGTAWCTKGFATAETQLKGGDFYVYYTNNADGEPTQPRLAIRMDGTDKIGEVRGILPHQNVEPQMQEVLDSKLKEFGSEADSYRKKSEDMKKLTVLDQKHEKGESFTKDDLILLYEINGQIEGFGYDRDPRIAELRAGRNVEEDMLVIFECNKDQIAHVPSEITENTKAYVGQLEPGIFQKLPETLEHVYTSFPDKKIRRENVEIGGKSAEELIAELEQAKIKMTDNAKFMLKSPEFVTGKNSETAVLIRLTAADLGFTSGATTEKIYKRAEELGLELCPAEVGPNYRLKYKNQPLYEYVAVGMKQITGSGGDPCVFDLSCSGDGLWLNRIWPEPDSHWRSDYRFVFRLRKSKT